jgi:hypothetical protein
MAIGARLEGAVHSHTRRALEARATAEEIYHVVLLGHYLRFSAHDRSDDLGRRRLER